MLYIVDEERYCENCASKETKDQAEYYNQNGEKVKYERG
jgi:hypothetical protein